jgi:alkylation response protein AidB-like acyl-CoA dehydrogenase
MDFRFSQEEEAFRREARDWIKKEVPQRWYELDPMMWEETDESWALSHEFQKKLGQKGWLAPAYPKQYGGAEMSHMKRLILAEELSYNKAPVGVEVEISVNWVGPDIMLFGSEEQKQKYVTGVAKGEIIFCLGYSEPNAGSDLASLQTTAIEEGDEYVVNGNKIWTSFAHYADYCWLAARTDPNAPRRYDGISMLVVDMKTPGITIHPLINLMNRHSFNEVFFDNVRIPKENLVGKKNNGWYELMIALDSERSSIGIAAMFQRSLEELVAYAKERGRDKDPVIRQKLADIAVSIEVSRMMCYRIAWMYSQDLHPSTEASMSMVFLSEILRRIADIGMAIAGPYGQLEMDSKWSPLQGRIERTCLNCLSIGVGGGTNEVQRNIIAQRGLGLPRR